VKVELAHDARWATRAAARTALFEYIEVFYHGQRRHSARVSQSPGLRAGVHATTAGSLTQVSTKLGQDQGAVGGMYTEDLAGGKSVLAPSLCPTPHENRLRGPTEVGGKVAVRPCFLCHFQGGSVVISLVKRFWKKWCRCPVG
jgi:hypothetical protein